MGRQRFPSDDDRYTISFPTGMRDRVKESAKQNKRTMNAEIIARLEESYSGNSNGSMDRIGDFFEAAMFRLNPVSIWFTCQVTDGKTWDWIDEDEIKQSIFETEKEKMSDYGITDPADIDLEDYEIEVYGCIRFSSDGAQWLVDDERGLSVSSFNITSGEGENSYKTKKEAETAFYSSVDNLAQDFLANFNRGTVEVVGGHLLNWPRETLKKLGTPFTVKDVAPFPWRNAGWRSR